MTPDCALDSATGQYECTSLSPLDLEHDFQLDDQIPTHRFQQEGPHSMPVQQLVELASGFALA
jgi:hypothetical protein